MERQPIGRKKVYLDACSWCRPYDDLSEPRNYIEAELLRMKDVEKLENVIELYDDATEYLTLTDEIKRWRCGFNNRVLRNMTACI